MILVMDESSSVYPEQSCAALEPVFIQHQSWLTAPPVAQGERLLEYLAHRVSRKPSDLLSHVQRVMLSARLHRHDELYGALLDLFIALGNKGCGLRIRLLAQCRGLISTEQFGALRAAVPSGIGVMDIVPMTEHSRLSAGISGNLGIVSLCDADTSMHPPRVIDEARDLLDSGQIEMARGLLEPALLASPQDEQLSQELLTMYHHTRNLAGLRAMLDKMASADFAAQDEWQLLANRLATGEMHG